MGLSQKVEGFPSLDIALIDGEGNHFAKDLIQVRPHHTSKSIANTWALSLSSDAISKYNLLNISIKNTKES